jgi:hypothetical protein
MTLVCVCSIALERSKCDKYFANYTALQAKCDHFVISHRVLSYGWTLFYILLAITGILSTMSTTDTANEHVCFAMVNASFLASNLYQSHVRKLVTEFGFRKSARTTMLTVLDILQGVTSVMVFVACEAIATPAALACVFWTWLALKSTRNLTLVEHHDPLPTSILLVVSEQMTY